MKHSLLVTLLAGLLVLAACKPVSLPAEVAVPAPEAATYGEAWEAAACATFDISDELAAQADCGYVTVQENRAANSASTIRLAVVRVRSTAETPASPVFLATGGPGGFGLARASAGFPQTFADVLADRDWVFFSQRGTKFAEPYLTCDDYDLIPLESASGSWSDEEIAAQRAARLQSCYDAFVAQGVDITGYNTNENATDVNDIRLALGYDKIVYMGESYGTMLGQFVMRNHPEILESVILDGIAPVAAAHWSDVTSMPGAFERVFALCAADEACNAAYPYPEGALADAFAALEANPQPIELSIGGQTSTVLVDGTLMMNGLFLQLYTPGGYALVPAMAYQMQANDLSALYVTLPLVLTPGGTARLMHFAIACADDPVRSLDDVNVEGALPMYVALAYDDSSSYVAACGLLNLAQLPAVSDEPVASDLPVLLLNGGLDPATPAEPARSLQATLPNSQYVVFPNGTHIQHNSPCGIAVIDAYMTDPSAPVDQSCISQEYGMAVPQRVSANSSDNSATFSVEIPPAAHLGPYAWLANSTVINLAAFPITTTLDDALNTYVGSLNFQFDNPGAVDTDQITGYTAKWIRANPDVVGAVRGLDIYAFSDESGTYLIAFITQATALIDSVRADTIPTILQTIEVGEQ